MSTIENLVTSLQRDWKEFSQDFSVVFRHGVLNFNQGILDLLGIEPDLSPEQEAEKERIRLLETYSVPGPKIPQPPPLPKSLLPPGVKAPPIQTSGSYGPKPFEGRTGFDGKVYGRTRVYGQGQ